MQSAPASITASKWRHGRLVGSALGVALAAIGFFVALERPTNQPLIDATRVAISRFDVADGVNTLELFADSLGEDLIGVLNENQIQTVLLDHGQATPRDADGGRRAGFAIGGTLRSVGDKLQVRIRLDAPVEHVTLWTSQFERPAADTDALRTAIAVATAEVVWEAVDVRRAPQPNRRSMPR